MKILITGSHFTPAQAVINELKKMGKADIVYLGRSSTKEGDKTPSVESQVLPRLGVKFIPITTGRLQRSFTKYTIPSLLKIPFGFVQSFYLLVKEKPDIVLSFGGYVSVPVVISSWLLSIPVIVHEQTIVSGLANKIGALFANKIAITFPQNYLSKKTNTVLTGNPIRKELLDDDENYGSDFKKIIQLSKKEKLPLILITGGNQGAHIINQKVSEILEDLTKIAFVVHQTGDSKFQDFEKLSELGKNIKNCERYIVEKWIHVEDLGVLFRNVDLVVSRGGANTLLELAYFGKPTLVIPLPYVYKNEQTINARFFKEKGLAQVLDQEGLNSESLLEKIRGMIKDFDNLKKEALKAKEVVIPDAAKRLALEVITLAKAKDK